MRSDFVSVKTIINDHTIKHLEEILSKIHGGGNGRRLLITKIEQLKKENHDFVKQRITDLYETKRDQLFMTVTTMTHELTTPEKIIDFLTEKYLNDNEVKKRIDIL